MVVTFATDPTTPPSERLQLAYLQSPKTSRTIKIHIDATQVGSGPDQTVITHVACYTS